MHVSRFVLCGMIRTTKMQSFIPKCKCVAAGPIDVINEQRESFWQDLGSKQVQNLMELR